MATITPYVHSRERPTAEVSTLDDLEQILWVRQWRTHPEGFYRFSISERMGDHLLMAETAFGLKSWVVGTFDRPLPGLPAWRQREPRHPWTVLVPGDLPTRRPVVRSTTADFRERAAVFELTAAFRLVVTQPDGTVIYRDRDENAAKAMAAGRNYFGPYVGMTLAAHEMTLELLGDEDTYAVPMQCATRFLVYCLESVHRTLDWRAYSVYEDSGESSEIVTGDGPELARQLDCDAI